MPNEFSRSGFHSGETASGYFDHSFAVTIAGTTRTAKCEFDTLAVHETANDAPNVAEVTVSDFTPAEGNEVKIFDGGIDVGVPLFCGHLIDVTASAARKADRASWDLQALDYRWLMDRYARVTKRYENKGYNVILADIIANYTNGGFTYGYCPMTLGNVTTAFTQARVSEALRQLADSAGAVVAVDYKKRVSLYVTPDDEGNTLSLTSSATDFWDVRMPGDLAQIRTRTIVEGGGSTTTAVVAGGVVAATTIPVNETGWYRSTGGTVRAGYSLITYTGVTTSSGPGDLTGCSGIAYDIAANDEVHVYAQADDAAAQAALSTLLGGLSGIATHFVQDHRLSLDECEQRAAADLTFYSAALQSIHYTTTNIYTRAGRSVSVNITTPRTLNDTLTIQTMTLKGRRKVASGVTDFLLDRVVMAGPVFRQFPDALVKAGVS